MLCTFYYNPGINEANAELPRNFIQPVIEKNLARMGGIPILKIGYITDHPLSFFSIDISVFLLSS